MRTIKAIIVGVVCLTAGAANAQWVVHDPGNLAQGIINTTKEIVETSATAQHTLDGFKETAKIFEQGRKYYDALKAVHDVVKGGVKVKKSIEMVADISEIYVRNYQKMLGERTTGRTSCQPSRSGTPSCSPRARTSCKT